MAQKFAGALILFLALCAPVGATTSPAVVVTPPQPNWVALTPPQKFALSPLASDWDKLENYQRKKWLGIARRFPDLKPEEQQRLQERMRDWVRLTPAERATARENYKAYAKLPADKRQALQQKWQEYQSLPEDERQRLQAQGTRPSASPPAKYGGAQ